MKRVKRLILSRPWQFMLLGGLIAMSASFGSTLAATLFLAHAGADAIPLYYMLFAVASIPVSILFSAVIDRWPRRIVLGGLLVVYMAGTALASGFLAGDPPAYYAIYVVISVCEQLLYSIYYILFADYFTVLEGKRHGGTMTIALGIGAICGSLGVSFLAELSDARRVFLFLPVLAGLALAHLLWLTGRERPLDETESAAEESMADSLKVIPSMCRRHPIVVLMMIAVFVNIAGQCVMEFEAFSLYARRFPTEESLAAFLGKMTAIVDLVGILIVFFAAEPLIPRIGVARMLAVPPGINLVSFLVLAASSSLPAGILAHLNYYPLEHSLNVPVFSLAYNAVPHRFVGRVRVINDGIIYPLALAASGLLLALAESVLPLPRLALFGAGLATLYLMVHWAIGRRYLRSLVDMLRSGTVDLDQIGKGFKLPDAYRADIAAMVRSEEADQAALGLELAARADIGLDAADIEPALPRVPRAIALAFLAACPEPQAASLLDSTDGTVRARALHSMILRGIPPDPARLADPAASVIAAAGLAAHSSPVSPRAAAILAGPISEEDALAALEILAARPPFPILREFGFHPSARVRARALDLAAGDEAARDWAGVALDDTDAAVRAAAARLLLATAAEEELPGLAERALASPEPVIRRAAALALGARGEAGLPILAAALRGSSTDVACEVMDGLALAGPEAADRILEAFFAESVFPAVTRNRGWIRRLPPDWTVVRLAIEHSDQRAIRLVLHTLEVLGYKRLLGAIRTAIRAGDPRSRANAIETLSSLSHRRYVLPLLPMLEEEETEAVPDPSLAVDLAAADDPFLREAALAATQCASAHIYDEEPLMNRLAFLKSVPLFSQMSLDHLLAVDGAMIRETYLPGETIVREGDIGDRLYVVFSGTVVVRKQERDLARLDPGHLFGEMALFDEEKRSATVTAATECELLSLDRDRFHSLAYQRPEIPMQLCTVLAARLRSAIS